MRIPTSKIYRAFEELDEFSDEQCERLMKRVQLDRASTTGMAGLVVCVVVVSLFVMGLFLWFMSELLDAQLRVLSMPMRPYFDLDAMVFSIVECITAVASGFLMRDHVLRKNLIAAIQLRIERVRCPNCKYILIGQRARNNMVTCPECGTSTSLGALGVTEKDLIPPTTHAEEIQQRVGATTSGI